MSEFPIPTTISLEAQNVLAMAAGRPQQPDPAHDVEVWRALAAAAESSDLSSSKPWRERPLAL